MGSFISDTIGALTGGNAAEDAANAAAAQQRKAAQNASYASQFRPVGMTTRFGTSTFERKIDPKTGMPYVSSAGYEAAPELAALQERLFSQFGGALGQAERMGSQYAPLGAGAESLFNLSQQYLATSPEQAASDYIKSQQGLLAGGREQQLANIRNQLFQTGRSGLATGGTTTGLQATNPEMAAYYNALSQQDMQLAANAQQAGQQRTQYGASLLGTGAGLLGTQAQGQVGAYAPLQNLLGLSGTVEQYAQQPYQLGMQLGAAMMPGQTAGASIYNQGFQNAANTAYQGAAQKAAAQGQFMSALIGSASGGMSGGGGSNPMSGFFNTNSTNSPFFNRGADVWSSNYYGGSSYGE